MELLNFRYLAFCASAVLFILGQFVITGKAISNSDILGCFVTADNATGVFGSRCSTKTSLSSCQMQCLVYKFRFAGMRNGSYCCCMNTFGEYGTSNQCTVYCPKSYPAETCGGTNAITVLDTGLNALLPNFTVIGCFSDNTPLDLPQEIPQNASNLSQTTCFQSCISKGYRYAGVQNMTYCYCGQSYGLYGQSSGCYMLCPGDDSQLCGGPYRNIIIDTGLGTNAAVNKPTTQSSTRDGHQSALSVDGVQNGTGGCSCTPAGEKNPWWSVDLGFVTYVSLVNITSYYYEDQFTLFAKAFEQVTVITDETKLFHDASDPGTYTNVLAISVRWSSAVIAVSSKPSPKSSTQNSITVSTDINDTMARNLTWKCKCYPDCPPFWSFPQFDDSSWTEVVPMKSDQNVGMGDDATTFWPQDCNDDTACCRVYLVPPRLRNFLVGMTNIPPSVSSPTVTTAHSLCATYNASVDPGSTVSVACDWNASPGRYLFIQIQGSMETLSLCEVQVYVRQTGDVPTISASTGKATYQSSTLSNLNSSLAVDGWKTMSVCSQTASEYSPWWAVDLGARLSVSAVTITTAAATRKTILTGIIYYKTALHDFIVGVTNIDPTVTAPSPGLYTVCATYDGNAPAASTFMLTCSDSSQVDGRYVILYMPFQFDSLIVCEVIVNFNPYSAFSSLAPTEDLRVTPSTTGCRMTRSGVDYAGTQNRTISGSSCIPWLNTAFKNSTAFPEGNATDASNYCRNPSPYVFVDGVWCFTTNSGLWEFCSVPLCDCTKWTATAGSYSTLGRFLSGYANVQSCLDACVGVYSDDVLLCEGVDIQLTPFACWFHIQNRTNVVITSEMRSVVNITQYWRNSTCTPEEIPLDNLACCDKNATMSSISADRPPGRAIDGMTNTSSCDDTFSPTYKTCAVSSINDNPWWAVDLGFRYFISTVIITSGVSEGNRPRNFIIAVADVHPPLPTTYSICSKFIGTMGVVQTREFSCQNNTPPARYVAIQMPFVQRSMTIMEVQVFGNGTVAPTVVSKAPITQTSDTYLIVGCFADSQSDRDLPNLALNSNSMTRQMCVSTCAEQGFIYSGLQSSTKCYCGNSFGSKGPAATSCNSTCLGEIWRGYQCGGDLANTVLYNKLLCRQWIFRPLTFSLGAVLYEQYTSLSACQDACMYDLDGCVAIDVGRSLTQCWVHYYNNTRLVSNINWPNVDQYALTDCFLPQSTIETTMSSTPTPYAATPALKLTMTDGNASLIGASTLAWSENVPGPGTWNATVSGTWSETAPGTWSEIAPGTWSETAPGTWSEIVAGTSTAVGASLGALHETSTPIANWIGTTAGTSFLSFGAGTTSSSSIDNRAISTVLNLAPTESTDPDAEAALTTPEDRAARELSSITMVPVTSSPPESPEKTTVASLVDVPITCDWDLTVTLGKVDFFRDLIGMYAIYTCDTGYHLTFGGRSRTIFCIDGLWNEQITECTAVSCSVGAYLNNPQTDQTVIAYPDIHRGICNGTELFDNGNRIEDAKCTAAGEYGILSKPMSVCADFRCKSPPVVYNATVSLDQTTRLLTVTCIPGHRLSDGLTEDVFQCEADGSWNNRYHCQVNFCEKLSESPTYTLNTDETIYNTLAVATCEDGLMFPDGILSKVLMCGLGAQWNDTTTDPCQPVFCADPPFIPFTTHSGLESRNANGLFPYGTNISYICLNGRKFDDGQTNSDILCTGNGYWLQTVFSCDYNRCDPIPTAAFATPNSTVASNGSVICYQCNVGYQFPSQTSETIFCDGQNWIGTVSECTVIRCPPLNDVHANMNSNGNVHGSVLTIECYPGYEILGRSSLTVNCTISGQWSLDAKVNCRPVNCGVPPALPNSKVSAGETTFGQSITYDCLPGFWFERDILEENITCQENRRWTNSTYKLCTAASCSPLVSYIVNSTEVTPYTALNVTCPDGHRLNLSRATSMETVCNMRGSWSPAVPLCVNTVSERRLTRVTPKEANGSAYIGWIAMALVTIALCALIFADRIHLIAGFRVLLATITGKPRTSFKQSSGK